jgi:hypothetical protein
MAPVKNVDVGNHFTVKATSPTSHKQQAERAMTRSDPFRSNQLLKPKLHALTLIVSGIECRITKETAQILLSTAISIVSASHARLDNYQKYCLANTSQKFT